MECHYAVTVKKNSKGYPDTQYYEDWASYAYKKKLRIVYKTYEYDDNGKLHLHGVGIGPINLYVKKFLTKGIHVNIQKLDTINDMLHWMIYIHKDMRVNYGQVMGIMEDFIDHDSECQPPAQETPREGRKRENDDSVSDSLIFECE